MIAITLTIVIDGDNDPDDIAETVAEFAGTIDDVLSVEQVDNERNMTFGYLYKRELD